jgi:hypothetical protein
MGRNAGILVLVMHAAFLVGCVRFGYTHHFEASAKGANITQDHYSAYIDPLNGLPRNAAEFRDEGVTVGCTNQRFDQLSFGFYELSPLPGHWPIVPFPIDWPLWPIPDLRKIEVVIDFGVAHAVEIDLHQIKLMLPARTANLRRARYFHKVKGHYRSDPLPLGMVVLRDAMDLTLVFDAKAGRVGSFSLDMPPFRIDGRSVALPRVTFRKVGGWAYYGD